MRPALIILASAFLLLHFWFGVAFVLKQPDIGWLIATGQYIVNTRSIPATDVFSWTHYGRPWILYQWLFEVIEFLLYRAGGLFLVGLATTLSVGSLYFFALPRQWMNLGISPLKTLPFLAASLSLPWFAARPQLASYWLLYGFLSILESYRLGKSHKAIFLLPLLMVLWVNLHSFWFLGLLAIGAYALFSGPAQSSQDSSEKRKTLLAVMLLSLVSTMVNPYGATIAGYIATFPGATDLTILELQAPFMPDAILLFLPFLIYVMMAAVILARNWRKVTPAGLFLSTLGLLSALAFRRYSAVAVILSWPYLGQALANGQSSATAGGSSTSWWSRPRGRVLHFCAALALSGIAWVTTVPSEHYALQTFTNHDLPMFRYISEHKEGGTRIFNDSTGSFLIFFGLGPVFIDTRYDFYGKDFSDLALSCIQAHEGWAEVLKRLGITHIVIKSDTALFSALTKSDEWICVARGQLVSYWLSRTKEHQALIDRWKASSSKMRP